MLRRLRKANILLPFTRHLSLMNILRAFLHHKYFWTLLLFIIVAGFIDEDSTWRLYKLRAENEVTRSDIRKLEQKFRADSHRLRLLHTDPDMLVRVAREQHFMKSEDEDVYIIIPDSVSEANTDEEVDNP